MIKKSVLSAAMASPGATKSTPKDYNSSIQEGHTVTHPEVKTIGDYRVYHASLVVLSNMLKSFHYTVVGMGFYTIHPKLKELYDELDAIIDETAELLKSYDTIPVLTLSEALSLTHIPEYRFSSTGTISCKDAMTTAHSAYMTLHDLANSLVVHAEENHWASSAAVYSEHAHHYAKVKWMIKAYLS